MSEHGNKQPDRVQALEQVIHQLLEAKLQMIPPEFHDLIPPHLTDEETLLWLDKAEKKGLFKSSTVTFFQKPGQGLGTGPFTGPGTAPGTGPGTDLMGYNPPPAAKDEPEQASEQLPLTPAPQVLDLEEE